MNSSIKRDERSFLNRAAVTLIGGFELARARWILWRVTPAAVLARNAKLKTRTIQHGKDQTLLQGSQARSEVMFAITCMAARVPWRSDCLVQAIGAQNWLARKGMPSEIRVGTRKRPDGSLEAHAWLIHDGAVVTGGEVGHYNVLIGGADEGAAQGSYESEGT